MMGVTRKTRAEVREAVRIIMSWDFDGDGDLLLNRVTSGICAGKSVLIDAVSYIGNGRYVKENARGRYRYKLIVPIFDRHGNLYSTDLFKGHARSAINGKYGIYSYTRQLVIDVIEDFETDYRDERFDYGYKKGDPDGKKWGQFKLSLIDPLTLTSTRHEMAEHCKRKRRAGRRMRTMEEVAKEIGISVSTYSRVENEKSIQMETAYKVRNWINGTA